MSFHKYPEYKDIDGDWLDELPESWSVKRLKYVASVRASGVDKHKREGEQEVKFLGTDTVYSTPEISRAVELNASTASTTDIKQFQIEAGDLLVTKDSVVPTRIADVSIIVEPMERTICGYHLVLIRPKVRLANPRFLFYCIKNNGANKYLLSIARGTTIIGISAQTISSLRLPEPSLPEQAQIARFLDHETAKIDALIREQERLIELLQEKRQAVISHAVTKGLDPDVPMKDSGVEWLGRVPRHWEIVPLKRVIRFQRGHDLPSESRKAGNIPVVSSGGISGWHDTVMARGPGIVTGRYGSIGQFMLVEKDYWPLNTALYSIELNNNEARYVWYLLHSISEHFVLNSMKSAVPGIDRNDIHAVLVALAQEDEQARIIKYLDSYCAQVDLLRAEADRTIVFLKERRSALISAAVTGKIDVRDWRPPGDESAFDEEVRQAGLEATA